MVIDRRGLLAASGALLAGVTAAGCGVPAGGSPTAYPEACVSRDALTGYTAVDGAELIYEINGRGSRFFMEPGFAGQLSAWLADWSALTGQPAVARLRTYGTWIDGTGEGCRSWHHAGRAFDIAGLETADGEVLASARYDVWGGFAEPERRAAELRYWALAAHVHEHFAYVLTHVYDTAHHNHIHLDNGRSGAARSSFDRASRTQVQAVRAMCALVWGAELEPAGGYDGATREAVRGALSGLGGGSLSDGDGWTRFLRGTVTRALEQLGG